MEAASGEASRRSIGRATILAAEVVGGEVGGGLGAGEGGGGAKDRGDGERWVGEGVVVGGFWWRGSWEERSAAESGWVKAAEERGIGDFGGRGGRTRGGKAIGDGRSGRRSKFGWIWAAAVPTAEMVGVASPSVSG